MKRILSGLLSFIILAAFGQDVRIDTLVVPPGQQLTAFPQSALRFPIIRTADLKINDLINTDLKNRYTDNEYPELMTAPALIKWADGQIIYLDFEVSYVTNGLISFNITAEGCGAHCSSRTDYYTYSTRTGKYVALHEIIDTTGGFKAMVVADNNRQYDRQRSELKEMLSDKESGLDEGSYNWAVQYYNDCHKSFVLEMFALHADHLEIVESCPLPNAIKNLSPIIELKYYYTDIAKYLKIRN